MQEDCATANENSKFEIKICNNQCSMLKHLTKLIILFAIAFIKSTFFCYRKTATQPLGSLGIWSSWSMCSASCWLESNPPIQFRFRTCNNVLGPCNGLISETQDCSTNTVCQGCLMFSSIISYFKMI